ncbi:diguanylate cyclase [Alishewanella longhuensis]
MLILGLKLLIFTLMLLPASVKANSYLFNTPTEPLLARQSSVYHISQDQDGFIWFGSDTDGLLRFDGNHSINWLNPGTASSSRININTFIFTADNDLWIASWRDGLRYHPKDKSSYVFAVDEQRPDALASQRVQTLFKDSKGRIWVGSIAGLHYVDLKQPYTLQRIAFAEPEHPLYQQRIWGITESAAGLWIATSQGIVLLDLELKTTQRFFLPMTTTSDTARAYEVRDIEYINQTVWAASASGVFYYQQDCDCFIKLPTPSALTTPRVNTLHPGKADTIWVGAADGLYQFDSVNLNWLKADQQYNFLPDVDIRSIFLDKDQQLWLGSREQGVFVGHQQHQSFELLSRQLPQHLAADASGLTTAIYHDNAGALWLVSQDKLLYRQADKITWQALEIRQQFGIRKVYRITEDPAGAIWLATDAGLFRVDDFSLTAVTTPFELTQRPVSAITELAISATGNFYLGLWQHGLIFWHPDLAIARLELTELSKTSGDQIYHIKQSDDGTLFAVSRYSGLFSKDPTKHEWRPLPLTKQKLVDGYNCVLPEADTFLWLCSEFGLWRFNRASREISQYAIAHGLPSMFISGAFFDNEQRFWALTNHGPARFDPELQRFVSYSKHDGLPDLSMQRNSFSVSQDGETLLGTANGAVLMHVMPEKESLKAPSLVISKLIINGVDHSRQYLQASGEIELPSSYRELIVGYALLDYRNPEMNTTRSRLLGLSSHWTPHDTNHEVRYVNLPPGQYTLEVEGQNARGIGTAQPLRLNIIVKAPWWTATWLWLTIVVVLFFAAVGFMQLQQINLNKRNQKLQQLVSERTSELEALTIKLKQRAEHDPLTGLLNRAGFTDRFKGLLQSCARQKQGLTLVLIDLDHFKQLNDQHGHNAGDKVLQHFSNLLRSRVRVTDAAGRWGGEEFIIAMGNCQVAGAKIFCDELLTSLQQTPCVYHQVPLYYTATFGVVSLPITVDSLDTWVKLADAALYQGKAMGRAQVVISATEA